MSNDDAQASLSAVANAHSGFLREAAKHPVAWQQWGSQAFNNAESQHAPILLSISFLTSRMGREMHREVFSDPELAEYINQHFVPVLVDREERSDVADLYQHALVATRKNGGWPVTAVLDEQGSPFFLASAVPAKDSETRVGLLTALKRVRNAWDTKREAVAEDAERMSAFLKAGASGGLLDDESKTMGEENLQSAFTRLVRNFDQEYGGFLGRPKFLDGHVFPLLQRCRRLSGGERVDGMIRLTLRRMARGGVRDHIGGGFHHCVIDERWHQPRFEKLLFDQALMAMAYTEARQYSSDPFYTRIIREIFDYLQREIRDPKGGYYASEGPYSLNRDGIEEEGAFYTLTEDDLKAALGEGDASLIARLYGFEDEGNLTDEISGERIGKNVLHFGMRGLSGVGGLAATDPDLVDPRIFDLLPKLRQYRAQRERPFRDRKVLLSWNALTLSAMAKAAWALDDQRLQQEAIELAAFLQGTMQREDGGLYRVAYDGKPSGDGQLEDYAFLARALFDLYQACFDHAYLFEAIALCEAMLLRFGDEHQGGLFTTDKHAEDVVARRRDVAEKRLPSGNAVAAQILMRLGRLCEREDFQDAGRNIVQGFSKEVRTRPNNFPSLMLALDFSLQEGQEVIVCVPDRLADDAPPIAAFLDELRRRFMPRSNVVLRREADANWLNDLVPYSKRPSAAKDRVTVYICSGTQSSAPLKAPAVMGRQLDLLDEEGKL